MSEAKRKRESSNDGLCALCAAAIAQVDEELQIPHEYRRGDREARAKRRRAKAFAYKAQKLATRWPYPSMPWAKDVTIDEDQIDTLVALTKSLQDHQSAMDNIYKSAKAHRIAMETKNDSKDHRKAIEACWKARDAEIAAWKVTQGFETLNYIISAFKADNKGDASDKDEENCESLSSKGDGSSSPEQHSSPVF